MNRSQDMEAELDLVDAIGITPDVDRPGTAREITPRLRLLELSASAQEWRRTMQSRQLSWPFFA